MKHARKVILILAIIAYLSPVLWLVLTAFKRRVDAVAIPPRLLFRPTVEHFSTVFIEKGFLRAMVNSFAVATLSTLAAVLMGTLAAYGLKHLEPKRRDSWLFAALSTRMVPPIVMVVPAYIIFQGLGLLDSYLAVILMHTLANLGFSIWLMSSYLGEISPRIEEIARLDGHSRVGGFFAVTMPLAGPGLLATATFSFLFSWNEYAFASILSAFEARTFPVGLPGLVSHYGTYWEQISAVGAVAATPALVIAFLGSRHLLRALSWGAVYGTR